MTVIKKLPPEVIGQIAAGEVVERPAAAIKELVENSIDAGATRITVEITEGGIRSFRVNDNGCGIPAGQLRMAFERHATSKITEAKDLFDLHTLGFRGEALASIAAVAHVTCITRTADNPFGTKAVVDNGVFLEIHEEASPAGTSLLVENLFQSVPVRLRFLKKPATEAAYISDYLLRLMISHPEIAFRFSSNGKTIYRTAGDGKLESVLFTLYGRDTFKSMKKVHGHMNGVIVDGYIGVGDASHGNRSQQSLFVNGRYFNNLSLSRAIENACSGRVMIGRYPMAALFLEMPVDQVDVNVHPNKLEVRFQNELMVCRAIETIVQEALQEDTLSDALKRSEPRITPVQQAVSAVTELTDPITVQAGKAEESGTQSIHSEPTSATAETNTDKKTKAEPTMPVTQFTELRNRPAADRDVSLVPKTAGKPIAFVPQVREIIVEKPVMKTPMLRESSASETVNAVMVNHALSPATPVSRQTLQPAVSLSGESAAAKEPIESAPQESEQLQLNGNQEQAPHFVGILFDTYWIFEKDDRMLLVDQHAAHERILYDRYMEMYKGGNASQQLLTPQLLRVSPLDKGLLSENKEAFESSGFEWDEFDSTHIAVRAIPCMFSGQDEPATLLQEAINECRAGHSRLSEERMRAQIAQMACKHAIKGGDSLSEVQIRNLLDQMLRSNSMPNCPHGRPIVVEVTRYQLEKRFKRIQ